MERSSSVTESTNYHVTSTPCLPVSAANVDDSGYCTEIKPPQPSFAEQHVDCPPLILDMSELCEHTQAKAAYAALSDRSTGSVNIECTDCKCRTELSDVTSGYFSESNHAKVSFLEQHLDLFPAMNLDASEDKIDTACHRVHSPLKTHAVLADSSSNCTNLDSAECQTRLIDITSSYSDADTVDRLPFIVYTEPEAGLLTHHSACASVHEQHTVSQPEPHNISASSCRDGVSHLLCMPTIAAVILRHVSDSDLCRY